MELFSHGHERTEQRTIKVHHPIVTDNHQLSMGTTRLLDAQPRRRLSGHMVHTLLIGGHAVAGCVALIAGCLAIRHQRAALVCLGSVLALVAFLAAALVLDWATLGTPTRVTFAALTVLGGYVIWRTVQAVGTRRPGAGPQSPQFLDHLGFTLISLLVGFVAIAVLNLGAPLWGVIASALGCIIGGHITLQRVKARESEHLARTHATASAKTVPSGH